MSWKKTFTDNFADILRFGAYIFIAFDAIALSAFLFWLICKFLWRFGQYLNHLIFENPWF